MPVVTAVRLTRAHAQDQARGLLGWVSFVVDGALLLDGVAIRRTKRGALSLSFPEPVDARGKRRKPVRPLDQAARRAFEQQVLGQLRTEITS
jgi:hypothetical protein